MVDERMRTTAPSIYAAGDVTGQDEFVYMAAYGAKLATKNALNGDSLRYDNSAMPSVVFTDPQVASVGLTEAGARHAGRKVRVSIVGLDQVPRALAARDTWRSHPGAGRCRQRTRRASASTPTASRAGQARPRAWQFWPAIPARDPAMLGPKMARPASSASSIDSRTPGSLAERSWRQAEKCSSEQKNFVSEQSELAAHPPS